MAEERPSGRSWVELRCRWNEIEGLRGGQLGMGRHPRLRSRLRLRVRGVSRRRRIGGQWSMDEVLFHHNILDSEMLNEKIDNFAPSTRLTC